MTSDLKVRCVRCSGRKQVYKVGGIYTLQNTGGVLVTCPLCNGEGKFIPFENLKKIENIETKISEEIKSEKKEEIKKRVKQKLIVG